jgi:hypothetical protein
MWELFNVNFNAKLILFLRLSNCASVGEKTLIIIKMHGMHMKITHFNSLFFLPSLKYDSKNVIN